MGFMDKAKKLAEQAQEKLDEAQKQFNSGGSTAGAQGENVRYDEHGRPIGGPPASDTPPPTGQPPAEAAAPGDPAAAEPEPTPPPSTGDKNANPDPFKPIQ